MIDYNDLSESCKAGAQAQSNTITKLMWDDIQTLKQDVKKLADAVNHIQEFLKKVHS